MENDRARKIIKQQVSQIKKQREVIDTLIECVHKTFNWDPIKMRLDLNECVNNSLIKEYIQEKI